MYAQTNCLGKKYNKEVINMFCIQCGGKLEEASNFCRHCGAKVSMRKEKEQDVEVLPSSIEGSLSQGAKESLAKLKEKYGCGTKSKALVPKKRTCESKELLIHVMDKKKRALKRAFPSENGLTGCISITTNYTETPGDWISALKTHFNGNMEFVLYIMDKNGLEPMDADCNLKKLESSKIQKKANLKIYAMVNGKGNVMRLLYFW
ncbi:uncharacterized protein LOC111117070 isoform X4 [Crassostrea virginica]